MLGLRSRATTRVASLAAAAALAIAACDSTGSVVLPSVPCSSTATPAGSAKMDAFALADVALQIDATGDGVDLVRADVASYLARMWSAPAPIAVSDAPPDFSKRLTIWISTSDAAHARAGVAPADGYSIKRIDGPSGPIVVVTARDATNLAYGAYALLEELGARFFHPMQELVATFAGPRVPATLDITRAPAMKSRGMQFHTLHPIEYFATFNQPSAQSLAEAEHVIDWLVKTGQNYFQWVLLRTVDFDAFRPHAQAIIDYAHRRGVTVGGSLQLWGGAALQNNLVLVNDATNWQPEMDAQLDKLLTIGWDVVDLQLGEFISSDPQAIIDWLNHAVDHIATTKPAVLVNVENHVGNYPNLYVMYQGMTVFYYHLPQFADPRLGQNVHTLSLFDVYRNWATYKHPDFHLQHDYLVKMLPTGRRVKYHPESAYWISADIDVPLFLPEFLYSRWNDVHNLVAEIRANALPPLYGHLMFSSGHEWGYWLTDYMTAKMLWEPDLPLDAFVARWGASYGDCAPDFATALSALVAIQSKYIFDQRLLAYVQGESTVVDLGYLAGLETHPQRVEFEAVLAMNDADRATFETNVVAALEDMATQMQPIEDAVSARCRGADKTLAPWCNEIADGVAIVRNRAQHAARVYRATLAKARGTDPEAHYQAALALHDEAKTIVARRETAYRFDLDRLTADYANPTVYGFGYLRAAHTLCYWERREQQVRTIIDEGVAPGVASLPSCAD
jgi:hypothetical protein